MASVTFIVHVFIQILYTNKVLETKTFGHTHFQICTINESTTFWIGTFIVRQPSDTKDDSHLIHPSIYNIDTHQTRA